MQFTIEIQETSKATLVVAANNKAEAENKAYELWRNGMVAFNKEPEVTTKVVLAEC